MKKNVAIIMYGQWQVGRLYLLSANLIIQALIKHFSITAKPGNYFWSNGYSWGNVNVNGNKLAISVHHGRLDIKTIRLSNGRQLNLKQPMTIEEGRSSAFVVQ